jgi:hypothetical protein
MERITYYIGCFSGPTAYICNSLLAVSGVSDGGQEAGTPGASNRAEKCSHGTKMLRLLYLYAKTLLGVPATGLFQSRKNLRRSSTAACLAWLGFVGNTPRRIVSQSANLSSIQTVPSPGTLFGIYKCTSMAGERMMYTHPFPLLYKKSGICSVETFCVMISI